MACQTHPKKGRFKMKTLKERLSAKLSKNGGFTLVEMLIVVAIIAILIMVSIPMVNSSLEKAREAVDDANERSAVSLMSVEYLVASETEKAALVGVEKGYVVDDTNSHQGTLGDADNGVVSKSAKNGSGSKHLVVSVDANGKVTTEWKS